MSDKEGTTRINGFGDTSNIDVVELWKDIGDGRHALVRASVGDSSADSGNSSETNLVAGGTFTGEWQDTLNYAGVIVAVYSDQDSAQLGLVFQTSVDGVAAEDADTYNYYAGTHKVYSPNFHHRYFRVKFVNGSTPQSDFHITTIFKRTIGVPSSHRIDDPVSAEDDAQLVQSILKAKYPDGIYRNINATINGFLNVGIGDIQSDAGVRVRVSQLNTLGDYKIIDADRDLLWDNAGTGTGSFSAPLYTMSVTAGQWLVRQTHRFHHYYSGKSQFIEMTAIDMHPESGVVKRIGYFSSSTVSPYSATLDGFWIESDGTTIRLISSRAGTETLNVAITDWSGYDKLGEYQSPSQWENFTVCGIDFLWLGGAIMRLWVQTSNGFVLAHQFIYAGTEQNVFIKSPSQPIRYEIRSSTGSGSMKYVCSQIASEGSIDESGLSRGISMGITPITIASTGTKYPLKGVRVNTSNRYTAAKLENFSIFLASNNDSHLWTVEINPTLSATPTWSAVPNSGLQEASGNGTITVTGAGTIVASGYAVQGQAFPANLWAGNVLGYLGQNISGAQHELWLCATPISGSQNVLASMAMKEY